MKSPFKKTLRFTDETTKIGYRLARANPSIMGIFKNIAKAEDFEMIQALLSIAETQYDSKRGNLQLLQFEDLPITIEGAGDAIAPFIYVNCAGSRFSTGTSGVLYLADHTKTAKAEVSHHLANYYEKVKGLKSDHVNFRELQVTFQSKNIADCANADYLETYIYNPTDYTISQAFGTYLSYVKETSGIQYYSVRYRESRQLCWGLFTPKYVKRILERNRYRMNWTCPMDRQTQDKAITWTVLESTTQED